MILPPSVYVADYVDGKMYSFDKELKTGLWSNLGREVVEKGVVEGGL